MGKAMIVQTGGGFDKVILGEREARAPEAGEITVRLHANSLNYHDYAVVSGMWGPVEPRIPMADGAGLVTAVGAGVSDFAVGDKVVSAFFPGWSDGAPAVADFATVPGDGLDGYAREIVTTAACAFTPAPKDFTHAEAATLTTAGLTAWRALHDDGLLKAGETVLVQGTGGVSIFALQFAKMAGATVIATSSSPEKLDKLEALGADHLIDYRKNPNWGEIARNLTGGRGVDHVIEVGGPGTLEQSMAAARIGGHVALIGILTGLAGNVPLITAVLKQLQLRGVLVGSRRQQLDMIRAIDANGLKPVIDRSFALEEIVAAFKYQESNAHFGKICLEF
jgi:NADPH:quinone reductase-like Zn-dependent oxidoreductase